MTLPLIPRRRSHSTIKYPKEKIKGDVQIIYGCPDDRYPHACLRDNFDLANKDNHRFLPCCCADDPKISLKSAYNRYYNPDNAIFEGEKDIISFSSKTMSSNTKLLGFGKRADLPQLPESFLLEKGFSTPIKRFGVHLSINSIIHCLFWAVQDIDYTSTLLADREEMVRQWRRVVMEGSTSKENINWNLRRNVFPAVAYQELYDSTDDDIRLLVSSDSKRFDSSLLYTILESYFGVNIFVFEEKTPKARANIEIPRNKIMHIRETRLDRPTVLLYKHVKSEDDTEPHYELININGKVLLGPKDTDRFFELFSDLYHTFIFPHSTVIENPYSLATLSLRSLLINSHFTLHGQYIDQYGKNRGLYVSFIKENKQIYGSILCMPQQPLDLPVYKSIIPLPYFTRDLFPDNITAKSIENIRSEITGFWFPLGSIELGFYVPFVDIPSHIEENTFNTNIVSNPLTLDGGSPQFSRFIDLEQRTTLFLELFTVVFKRFATEMYNKAIIKIDTEEKRKRTGDRFLGDAERSLATQRLFKVYLASWNNMLIVDPTVVYIVDNEIIDKIENMSKFNDFLIAATNTGIVKNISNKGEIADRIRIVLNSDKLLKDMQYYSKTYLQKQPASLFTMRTNKGPITQFNSIEELEAWASEQFEFPHIVTNAADINPYIKRPIYYYDLERGLFIIQNVAEGNREAAIQVAYTYRETGKNIGYSASRAAPDILSKPIKEYQIAGSSIITYDHSDMPAILQLRDGIYAALFRLISR